MTEEIRMRIMSALLKSLYEKNFISEDIYNHSLDNLPKTLGYGQRVGCDAVEREADANGCL